MKLYQDLKRFSAFAGPSLVLAWLSLICKLHPANAFLNCFTPGMFKNMGKLGAHQQPTGLGYASAPHPGERAAWYGQPTVQAPPPAYFYGRNPMSRLFGGGGAGGGSKWGALGGGGGGLFGPKRWMDWRGMNFYRPGYGYWPPSASPLGQQPGALAPATNPSNYNTQLAEQLNLQAAYNSQLPGGAQFISPPGGYSPHLTISQQQQQQQQLLGNNDGWTVPSVLPNGKINQQQLLQLPYGDSYSVLPGGGGGGGGGSGQQSGKQQVDPYGTKGGSGGSRQNQQQQQGQYGTTKNAHDAHLASPQYPSGGYVTQGVGYSYPEWYAGNIDSPAKIAQQLLRMQRLRATADATQKGRPQ